eukprot:scaffold2480_cov385-Prasinococcus_capsulatus_cf.AAC.5
MPTARPWMMTVAGPACEVQYSVLRPMASPAARPITITPKMDSGLLKPMLKTMAPLHRTDAADAANVPVRIALRRSSWDAPSWLRTKRVPNTEQRIPEAAMYRGRATPASLHVASPQ